MNGSWMSCSWNGIVRDSVQCCMQVGCRRGFQSGHDMLHTRSLFAGHHGGNSSRLQFLKKSLTFSTIFGHKKAENMYSLKASLADENNSTQDASDIIKEFHLLPDGMKLEVRKSFASERNRNSGRPPLLFLHGSYHGPWCYAENFLPYFSAAGYDSIAIAFRAQGESDRGDLKIAGDMDSHVADIASFIKTLSEPPVLIAHSFGGLIAEKYVSMMYSDQMNQTIDGSDSDMDRLPPVAGIALLASVPPSGNKDIIMRITKKSLVDSFKITMAFVFRTFEKNIEVARETFFSKDIPRDMLQRYHAKLAEASPVRLLDLANLNKKLPLPPLPNDFFDPKDRKSRMPVLVAGGTNDLVVDVPALEEAAIYFGTEPILIDDMAHDCMLDTRWENMAQAIQKWLDENM